MILRHRPRSTRPGVELVRKLSAEGDSIFTIGRARELAPAAGLSREYLPQALHHLVRLGWLVRLRKGLYALAPTVPGVSPTHEFEVAMALVQPAAISHWSALHHHGLTEQIPREVFVLTTKDTSIPRLRGEKRNRRSGYWVENVAYRFVQIRPERFFGTEKVWLGEVRITITDPERTLLDGLTLPRYCGDFAEVLHAFRLRGNSLDVERIVAYALRLDAAIVKRLGWVLESHGLDSPALKLLERHPVKGYRKLDPSGPRTGPRNHRWMIQENFPREVGV